MRVGVKSVGKKALRSKESSPKTVERTPGLPKGLLKQISTPPPPISDAALGRGSKNLPV